MLLSSALLCAELAVWLCSHWLCDRFGVWKNRWQILKLVPLPNPSRVRELIVALIYLHNYLENSKDGWLVLDDEEDDDDDEDAEPEPVPADAEADAEAGRARRQQMMDALVV